MKSRILLVIILLFSSLMLVGCKNRENQPDVDISISVSPNEGGTVESNYPTFKLNDGVILTANPKDGYIFKSWEVDGTIIENANRVYKFRAFKDQQIKAMFVESFSLDVEIEPDGSGKVKAEEAYEKNTEITIVADPDYGYQFIKWVDANGDDVSHDDHYTFTINDDTTLTAVFEKTDASESTQIITFVVVILLIGGGVALTITLKKKREKNTKQTKPNE